MVENLKRLIKTFKKKDQDKILNGNEYLENIKLLLKRFKDIEIESERKNNLKSFSDINSDKTKHEKPLKSTNNEEFSNKRISNIEKIDKNISKTEINSKDKKSLHDKKDQIPKNINNSIENVQKISNTSETAKNLDTKDVRTENNQKEDDLKLQSLLDDAIKLKNKIQRTESLKKVKKTNLNRNEDLIKLENNIEDLLNDAKQQKLNLEIAKILINNTKNLFDNIINQEIFSYDMKFDLLKLVILIIDALKSIKESNFKPNLNFNEHLFRIKENICKFRTIYNETIKEKPLIKKEADLSKQNIKTINSSQRLAPELIKILKYEIENYDGNFEKYLEENKIHQNVQEDVYLKLIDNLLFNIKKIVGKVKFSHDDAMNEFKVREKDLTVLNKKIIDSFNSLIAKFIIKEKLNGDKNGFKDFLEKLPIKNFLVHEVSLFEQIFNKKPFAQIESGLFKNEEIFKNFKRFSISPKLALRLGRQVSFEEESLLSKTFKKAAIKKKINAILESIEEYMSTESNLGSKNQTKRLQQKQLILEFAYQHAQSIFATEIESLNYYHEDAILTFLNGLRDYFAALLSTAKASKVEDLKKEMISLLKDIENQLKNNNDFLKSFIENKLQQLCTVADLEDNYRSKIDSELIIKEFNGIKTKLKELYDLKE
ncbi:MAG: hypothetical protein MHPSP_000185, partial [Paramarteilia canceri]